MVQGRGEQEHPVQPRDVCTSPLTTEEEHGGEEGERGGGNREEEEHMDRRFRDLPPPSGDTGSLPLRVFIFSFYPYTFSLVELYSHLFGNLSGDLAKRKKMSRLPTDVAFNGD